MEELVDGGRNESPEPPSRSWVSIFASFRVSEKPENQYKAWYGPSGHQISVLQIRSDIEDVAGQMLKILT